MGAKVLDVKMSEWHENQCHSKVNKGLCSTNFSQSQKIKVVLLFCQTMCVLLHYFQSNEQDFKKCYP